MNENLLRITGAVTRCLTKHQYNGLEIKPLILKISLVILLTAIHIIQLFMMAIWEIGIGSTDNPLKVYFPYSHQLFV